MIRPAGRSRPNHGVSADLVDLASISTIFTRGRCGVTPYLRQWAPPEFMRDCRRAYRRAGSTDQGVEEAVPFRLRPKSQVRDARLVNSVRLRSRSQAHCSSSTPPTTTASSAAMNRRNAMCRTARHDLSLRCDGSNARRRDLRRSRTAGNASAYCDRRSTHRFRTRGRRLHRVTASARERPSDRR